MLKKIMVLLVILAIGMAVYMYITGAGKADGSAEIDVDAALSVEESQAVELLTDEIMEEQCSTYAKEDGITEDKLKEYLDSCVEQLRAEATMVEPGFEGRTPEEIQEQCAVYAKEDSVKEDKLAEYMDLCAEQLRAEDTMIEPEDEMSEEQEASEEDVKAEKKGKTEEKKP